MDTQFDQGLVTRKQVMGEDFVASAFAKATEFTMPMQQYITRNAWGDVWQRPGLDRKTRSLVTVAMLTALGKQHELKGHVRGALNNGATVSEIQEVLLHASIYCGVPTAVRRFGRRPRWWTGQAKPDFGLKPSWNGGRQPFAGSPDSVSLPSLA